MNETSLELNLIAPAQYNITEELEKYAQDETRQAIRWVDSKGNRRVISYKQLIENMNQYANANEDIIQLANDIIVLEQNFANELRQYL